MPGYHRPMVLAAVLLAGGCHLPHAAPDGREAPHVTTAIEETPPTPADAAAATYWGGQARQITLTDGEYTGPDGQRVELLRDHYVVADLEGDGAVDAVVALRVTEAGAENGDYVAVLRHLGTDTISLGTAALGPGERVQALSVDGRRILVTLADAGTGASAAVAYELGRGELVRIAAAAR